MHELDEVVADEQLVVVAKFSDCGWQEPKRLVLDDQRLQKSVQTLWPQFREMGIVSCQKDPPSFKNARNWLGAFGPAAWDAKTENLERLVLVKRTESRRQDGKNSGGRVHIYDSQQAQVRERVPENVPQDLGDDLVLTVRGDTLHLVCRDHGEQWCGSTGAELDNAQQARTYLDFTADSKSPIGLLEPPLTYKHARGLAIAYETHAGKWSLSQTRYTKRGKKASKQLPDKNVDSESLPTCLKRALGYWDEILLVAPDLTSNGSADESLRAIINGYQRFAEDRGTPVQTYCFVESPLPSPKSQDPHRRLVVFTGHGFCPTGREPRTEWRLAGKIPVGVHPPKPPTKEREQEPVTMLQIVQMWQPDLVVIDACYGDIAGRLLADVGFRCLAGRDEVPEQGAYARVLSVIAGQLELAGPHFGAHYPYKETEMVWLKPDAGVINRAWVPPVE